MRVATDLAGYSASESDLMRRAVAKKKEKDLLEHKSKMIEGGREKGIADEVMSDIFGDIEAFARYGFPKGHAADYAVITCQTAFLKAHYPAEYMTALLTVEHNNTEKVGLLVEECRSMGIAVLPPNVNYSGNGFTIEDGPKGESIRFGMGGIKNVGEGPIEALIEARDDQPFTDVDDFCQRVDLRKVGKRALESLIKVGALEDFGPRAQLLAIIDRMTRLSSTTHQAASVGQMSMFDLGNVSVPVTGSILDPLPEVTELKQRVLLGWEKELVGAYISSHPLQAQMEKLKEVVTCFCGDLEQLQQDRRVTVAGLVSKVRHTTTKKGDSMAFVEIEDVQGSLEVIVFPKTFSAYKHLLNLEDLILVVGKVDAKDEGRPKILADTISNEITTHRPADQADSWRAGSAEASDESYDSYRGDADTLGEDPLFYQTESDSEEGTDVLPPEAPPPAYEVSLPKQVALILSRSSNLEKDIATLQSIYNLLKTYPGQDRFELCIPVNGHAVEIGYDLKIRYNAQLASDLKNLGVRVQEVA
jgi:DNA polymerase-3 subunit alpha